MQKLRVIATVALLGSSFLVSPGENRPGTAHSTTSAPLPAVCNLGPVMPPSKDPAAFEAALDIFLWNRCYQQLGWAVDKNLRDTGPFIDIPLLEHYGQTFGTHPAVQIYYSPQVMKWLDGGRKGAIADGGIIVKEMHIPPAADANCVNGWTTMVRDSQGSWDGWYWSYAGNQNDEGCTEQPVPDSTSRDNVSFPNSGFGNYCINCHASTDNAFSTFIDRRNLDGKEMTYLVVEPSMEDPAKKKERTDLHEIHAMAALSHTADKPAAPDMELLKFLGVRDATLPPPLTFPGETWDHVVSRAPPQGPEQFVTSDQCIGCHDATQNFSAPPNMIYPASGENGNEKVANLSQYGEWRASMMGLAGRDPVFYAQLASERSLHNQNPDLPVGIQNLCFRCHGVMGQRQLALDSGDKTPFLADYVYEWQTSQPHWKYAALARDGVSCAACHHISADGLGSPATFTGKFKVGPPNELNGPFDKPVELPMNNALGIKPIAAPQIKSAALCGSCHAIFLPVYNSKGAQVGESHEQTTYLEWLNSVFQNEIPPFGSNVKTCQDCHMPSVFQKTGYEPQDLAYRAANIEDNTFAFVDNRAPDKDISLQIRSPYARHTLLGANLFVLKMFSDFPKTMGIRVKDPMATFGKPIPILETAQSAALDLARKETAKVEILSVNKTATTLDVTVKVANRAGHFFPSGVSFRRAFINFEVVGPGGRLLWASGRTNQYGAIVEGTTENVLPSEFFLRDSRGQQQYQPHYQKITSQSQVQIYEELMKSPPPESLFTTSFVALYDTVKENRLQPRGYSRTGPYADKTKPDPNTAKDPDYNNGSGADVITYSVPLSELGAAPASVHARVYYQTIPPYYLLQRFTDSTMPDTYRLMDLVAMLNVRGTQIANWKLEIAGASRSLQ